MTPTRALPAASDSSNWVATTSMCRRRQRGMSVAGDERHIDSLCGGVDAAGGRGGAAVGRPDA